MRFEEHVVTGKDRDELLRNIEFIKRSYLTLPERNELNAVMRTYFLDHSADFIFEMFNGKTIGEILAEYEMYLRRKK